MTDEIQEHIRSLSDEDLLEYIEAGPEVYRPEAIAFAQQDVERRGLSQAQVKELGERLGARSGAQAAEVVEVGARPLSWPWRVALFLCGLFLGVPLVFFIPAWLRFREDGERRKFREMWLFALAGLVLQVLLVYLNVPPWSWIVRTLRPVG